MSQEDEVPHDEVPHDEVPHDAGRVYNLLARVGGSAALTIGAVVLFGWIFGIEQLTQTSAARAATPANVALALLLLGGAIVLIAASAPAENKRAPRHRRPNGGSIAGVLALAAGAIGLLTLAQYVFGANLQIDELLIAGENLGPAVTHSGRPAAIESTMMLMSGAALALTVWRRDRKLPLRQLAAAATLLAALVALLNYAYEANVLLGDNARSTVALPAAAGFLLVGFGTLCLCPREGWMRVISGAGTGSSVVRRLLPLALFGIPALGFLILAGRHAGFYDGHYGAALFATAVVALMSGAVLWVGARLNSQEDRSIVSEAQRDHMQALLEGLVENSESVIVIQDTEGRFVLVNRAFERQRRISRERAIGHTIDEVFPKDEAVKVNQLRRHVLKTGKSFFEETTVKDGRFETTYFVQTFPITDRAGTALGTGAIATDITERKEQERLMRALNADLERETERASEAIAEHESFAHTVSHDLRSPLRAIDGFSRIVLSENGAALNERANHYLGLVLKGVSEMNDLINGLLEFSRLGRKELEKTQVDMTVIADQANARLAPERLGRDVRVEIAELPAARADRGLMLVVFTNLLSNAHKYTRKCRIAEIQVGAIAAEAGRPPTYFVRDNGIGFDMQYADKLFGVFERLHRSEDYEGSGVGLATVQRIIRRHGGCVWAQSEPGKGTTMFFQLSREENAND